MRSARHWLAWGMVSGFMSLSGCGDDASFEPVGEGGDDAGGSSGQAGASAGGGTSGKGGSSANGGASGKGGAGGSQSSGGTGNPQRCGDKVCAADEYCNEFVGGVPGSQPTYQCKPLNGCQDCECLEVVVACQCSGSGSAIKVFCAAP